MKLKLAISPCPNDTFMFDALINKRIDVEGIDYIVNYSDIEELNTNTGKKIPDISKISVAAYPDISDEYEILDSGSALGNNNGPILISKKLFNVDQIENISIAIPGMQTTANLLLNIAFPKARNKCEVLFSKIENDLMLEKFDAGLIIHESRFTFHSKGLHKIVDLGQYWELTYKMPIALGCIVVRRSLPLELKKTIESHISKSIFYASENKNVSKEFVKQHSQELADEVIEQHIALYVNDYSVSLGKEGKKAIQFLFDKGYQLGLLKKINKSIFI